MEKELLLSDYDFMLPKELIAQDPLSNRCESKLMVLERDSGLILHKHFFEIIDYFNRGDTLVINNTKVIPARLYGRRSTGAAIEVLLLKRLSDNSWEALTKPGKRTGVGSVIDFGEGKLKAEVTDIKEDGIRVIEFDYDGIFEEILDELGEMPLPPYITHKLNDKSRYQTVYAKYEGSAAAPTAGLHFTKELLSSIKEKGVNIAEVTLHVGLGTFRPVKEENALNHKMHTEHYEVSKDAYELLMKTKEQGNKVIAVGTTSVRTLETIAKTDPLKLSGDTDIFIYPGHEFKLVDAMITNFHLPKSTLLMLVSAFAGRDRILDAYSKAICNNYRFFSFGDAMLLY